VSGKTEPGKMEPGRTCTRGSRGRWRSAGGGGWWRSADAGGGPRTRGSTSSLAAAGRGALTLNPNGHRTGALAGEGSTSESVDAREHRGDGAGGPV
jgi:hypothetical protein